MSAIGRLHLAADAAAWAERIERGLVRRQLAERDGLTLDAQLDQLIRRERRRIIGAQLSSAPLDDDDVAVLDASASDVADASR